MPATGRSIQFRTGYKEGGGVKKEGIISRLRKKFIPTYSEQFAKAKAEGKETFTSTRKKKKGSGWTGEELGRVDAERAGTPTGRRNLSAEKKRIIREIRAAKPKMGKMLSKLKGR